MNDKGEESTKRDLEGYRPRRKIKFRTKCTVEEYPSGVVGRGWWRVVSERLVQWDHITEVSGIVSAFNITNEYTTY